MLPHSIKLGGECCYNSIPQEINAKLGNLLGMFLIQENDTPESAVANLFASAKTRDTDFSQYGLLHHCLQNLPSEGQMRVCMSTSGS